MSVWVMPITAPITMDAPAITPSTGCQVHSIGARATWQTRNIAANAATLVQDAMNAVMGVGAPWYTSGVHRWNGPTEALNSRPTSTSARPPISSTSLLSPALAWLAMAVKEVDPAYP